MAIGHLHLHAAVGLGPAGLLGPEVDPELGRIRTLQAQQQAAGPHALTGADQHLHHPAAPGGPQAQLAEPGPQPGPFALLAQGRDRISLHLVALLAQPPLQVQQVHLKQLELHFGGQQLGRTEAALLVQAAEQVHHLALQPHRFPLQGQGGAAEAIGAGWIGGAQLVEAQVPLGIVQLHQQLARLHPLARLHQHPLYRAAVRGP